MRGGARQSGPGSGPTRSPPISASGTSETAANMQPAPDAIRIDTTALTVDDVVDRIETLVRERMPA